MKIEGNQCTLEEKNVVVIKDEFETEIIKNLGMKPVPVEEVLIEGEDPDEGWLMPFVDVDNFTVKKGDYAIMKYGDTYIFRIDRNDDTGHLYFHRGNVLPCDKITRVSGLPLPKPSKNKAHFKRTI